MRNSLLCCIILLVTACSSSDPASLCDRFFTPYPDHITGRQRTGANADLLDAMAFYSDEDYAKAIVGLQRVLDKDVKNINARIYMASAQLAVGDPYTAEMHLDFMENYRDRSYKDQVEWYNALCWLCEGDTARAGPQARWIASNPHTYRSQARQLADALAGK